MAALDRCQRFPKADTAIREEKDAASDDDDDFIADSDEEDEEFTSIKLYVVR